jgi:hypothetical protein
MFITQETEHEQALRMNDIYDRIARRLTMKTGTPPPAEEVIMMINDSPEAMWYIVTGGGTSSHSDAV